MLLLVDNVWIVERLSVLMLLVIVVDNNWVLDFCILAIFLFSNRNYHSYLLPLEQQVVVDKVIVLEIILVLVSSEFILYL